jgi:hypothetical protein
MSKRYKLILIIGIIAIPLVLLFVVTVLLRSGIFAFFAMQADSVQHAGTWEDDPQNWYRAFGEQKPPQVQVIHSKYWRSDHFTYECIYYFEVKATPEWKDEFLKKNGLIPVSPSVARSFRTNNHSDDTPAWFAPDPVELYDVWDMPGYFGSVWMNKTNGYFYFYNVNI